MNNKKMMLDPNPMTLKEWLLTFFLVAIPIIGLIFLFVWSLSDSIKLSKKTWAQCMLLFLILVSVSWLVIVKITSIRVFPFYSF